MSWNAMVLGMTVWWNTAKKGVWITIRSKETSCGHQQALSFPDNMSFTNCFEIQDTKRNKGSAEEQEWVSLLLGARTEAGGVAGLELLHWSWDIVLNATPTSAHKHWSVSWSLDWSDSWKPQKQGATWLLVSRAGGKYEQHGRRSGAAALNVTVRGLLAALRVHHREDKAQGGRVLL